MSPTSLKSTSRSHASMNLICDKPAAAAKAEPTCTNSIQKAESTHTLSAVSKAGFKFLTAIPVVDAA